MYIFATLLGMRKGGKSGKVFFYTEIFHRFISMFSGETDSEMEKIKKNGLTKYKYGITFDSRTLNSPPPPLIDVIQDTYV